MMKRLILLLASGGAAVALLIGIPYLAPNERNRLNDDRLGVRDWSATLRTEQRRGDELEARRVELLRYLKRKDAIARAVIAGRMALPEAAARFREVDQENHNFHWDSFRASFPGSSDEERHCRHVIALVGALLETRPAEAEEAVARLEAELWEHLRYDGTVRLPEVSR